MTHYLDIAATLVVLLLASAFIVRFWCKSHCNSGGGCSGCAKACTPKLRQFTNPTGKIIALKQIN